MSDTSPIANFSERLTRDDHKVMTEFVKWMRDPVRTAHEIEEGHDFIEFAANHLRSSRVGIDREVAARQILDLFRTDSRRLGMHDRFLASVCGSLCTYFQNRKIWDTSVECCEFLVSRGIPDEDGVGFHERLDWLYRQRARRQDD